MPRPRLILPALIAALALLSACATLPYAKIEGALGHSDLTAARAALAEGEKEYGSKARLLYLMDTAVLAHYDRDWAGSNKAIEEAVLLMDELYTKSLSAEAASFLVNDMSVPYTGENFERVMLHVLGMLNYAALGDRAAALVESKRADERLKQYAASVGEDKVAYREDALARYVSAALYEGGTRQELWDAYLDYKKADEAYDLYAKLYGSPKPQRLKADLQRLAEGLGEKEALEAFKKRDGAQAFVPLSQTRSGQGEVIVLLYEGLAPAKVSKSLHLPIALDDGTQQYFSLALPDFVVRGGAPGLKAVLSAQGSQAPFELVQDINAIAVRDLADRSGLVTVKATARALAKFQAARQVQKTAREQGGDGAELLAFLGTNIFSIATEQADIRSWRTLPGRIYLARIALPPGAQGLQVIIPGHGDDPVLDLGSVDLKAGEKRFFVRRIP